MYVISQSPGVARINSVWDCAVDLYIKNSLRISGRLYTCIMSYGGVFKYVRECKLVSTFSGINMYVLSSRYPGDYIHV